MIKLDNIGIVFDAIESSYKENRLTEEEYHIAIINAVRNYLVAKSRETDENIFFDSLNHILPNYGRLLRLEKEINERAN